MSNNDPDDFRLLFPTNNLLIPLLQDSENLVSNIFNVIFDYNIEYDRFNEAVQNSIETYNDELFKKKNEYRITIKPVWYSIQQDNKKCLICLNLLDEWIYELSCKHMFHVHCLDDAIAHQHYKCCICNKSIPIQKLIHWQQFEHNDDGHTIFLSGNQED